MGTVSENTRMWDQTLSRIEQKLGGDKPLFDSFFAGTYVYNVKGDTITVVVQTKLAQQILSTQYYDFVKDVVSDVTSLNYQLEFVVEDEIERISEPSVVSKKQIYFKDAVLNPNLTFENYVVGDSNRQAEQAALIVASNPGHTIAQPLFLYGNTGLGKTHLMHAIGNYITKTSKIGAKVIYIQAQDFIDEYVKYVRGDKEAETVKDYLCNFDVLLFDDIQMLKDKVKTQEQLFAIYEKMANTNKQLVFASDRQPSELNGLEDRLISRFSQGLVMKIDNLDKNTCIEILRKKVQQSGINPDRIDSAVLSFYGEKFSKNVRELEGALKRLIFFCQTIPEDQQITLDVATKAVENLSGSKSFASQLNEQKIINIVADYYGLTPTQITGTSRLAQIVLARHLAMYLIRNNLDVSQEKIGLAFGGKDHTSVMHAIEKVNNELITNPQLKDVVNELTKRINK